jgi:hypothetical protein
VEHESLVQAGDQVLLVAHHGLGCQVGVLDIVAILLNLAIAERRLVAGRHWTVSQSQGQHPDKQVIEVRRYRRFVWTTRSYLSVQQQWAASHRHSMETTPGFTSYRHSKAIGARYRFSA